MRIAHLLSGVVLTSALGLQSCQQEPLKMPAREEYAREFYKNFKNVDPDHDWNQAQKSSVTVKTSRPSSIKVMADIKGKRYLFADYREASGSNEIPLTLPKSVTDIIVKVNGQNFPAKLGATVDATSASRQINEGSYGSDFLTYGKAEEITFPASYIGDVLEVLPEEKVNIHREDVITDFSFVSEAGKDVVIYPIYWNTRASHVLGVYWLNEDEDNPFPWCANVDELKNSHSYNDGVSAKLSYANMQDLYYTRSGEIKFCRNYNGNIDSPDNEWQRTYGNSSYPDHIELGEDGKIPDDKRPIKGHFRANGIKLKFNKSGLKYGFYIKVADKDKDENTSIEVKDEWGNVSIQKPFAHLNYPEEGQPCTDFDHVVFCHSRRNKNFGRVIKVSDGFENYQEIFHFEPSTPENNYDDEFPGVADKSFKSSYDLWGQQAWNGWMSAPEGTNEGLTKYVGAAYFHATSLDDGQTRTFFAFEDYRLFPDLNDLVFMINSEVAVIEEGKDPEPEPYQWIIAAEDLGGSYDWDFNDVVAGVSIQAVNEGEKEFSKVTVTPLASGGTLPVYFMYSGEIVDPKTGDPIANSDSDYVIGGEFHSLFGKDFGSYINASKGKHIKAEPITFYTPAGHSLASSGHVHYDGKNMGGFWVLAAEMNSPLNLNPANNYGLISIAPGTTTGFNKITNSKPIASEDLTAPQIICVEAEWAWPLEETNIKKAYSEFETWVENAGHNTWINTKNGELTVDR